MKLLPAFVQFRSTLLHRSKGWNANKGKYVLLYSTSELLNGEQEYPKGVLECFMIDHDFAMMRVDANKIESSEHGILSKIKKHYETDRIKEKEGAGLVVHSKVIDSLLTEEIRPIDVGAKLVVKDGERVTQLTNLMLYGQKYFVIPIETLELEP